MPAGTQERGQCGICCCGVVNRARCELFREIRGEKGVIEAWRDAAFGLADHASGYPESLRTGALRLPALQVAEDGRFGGKYLHGIEDRRLTYM